jgi:hypothetical protein
MIIHVPKLGFLELLQVLNLLIILVIVHFQSHWGRDLPVVELVPINALEEWMSLNLVLVIRPNSLLWVLVE